jgi:molybdopterin converting factor subunit 1
MEQPSGPPAQPHTLRVVYYALLREQAGRDSEELRSTARTPAALYAELAAKYGFQLHTHQLRAAVNGEFASFETALQGGDEVVFIPPVAGGAP